MLRSSVCSSDNGRMLPRACGNVSISAGKMTSSSAFMCVANWRSSIRSTSRSATVLSRRPRGPRRAGAAEASSLAISASTRR